MNLKNLAIEIDTIKIWYYDDYVIIKNLSREYNYENEINNYYSIYYDRGSSIDYYYIIIEAEHLEEILDLIRYQKIKTDTTYSKEDLVFILKKQYFDDIKKEDLFTDNEIIEMTNSYYKNY